MRKKIEIKSLALCCKMAAKCYNSLDTDFTMQSTMLIIVGIIKNYFQAPCNNHIGCDWTKNELCGLNEGPCQNDSQCLDGLICEPNSSSEENLCNGTKCCQEPFSCGFNHSRTDSCCSSMNKCSVDEGKCSGNSDCLGNLQCGINNCGWSNETNCCTHPDNIGGKFLICSI